jgi:hypothetical protein
MESLRISSPNVEVVGAEISHVDAATIPLPGADEQNPPTEFHPRDYSPEVTGFGDRWIASGEMVSASITESIPSISRPLSLFPDLLMSTDDWNCWQKFLKTCVSDFGIRTALH